MGRNSTIQISILADTNRAQRALSSLSTEALGLGKVLAFPTVVPALAAVTAGIGELGTALGLAAGAGAVFGLSVGGITLDMIKAQKAIDKTQIHLATTVKGTEDYRNTMIALHQQQVQFQKDFGPADRGLQDLTAAFDKFKNQTRTVTLKVMHDALESLADILPKLVPISNAAGKAVDKLVNQFRHFSAGAGFQSFLNTLKTSGVKDLTAFAHIVGNVISGIASILKNFVGPGDKFTASIEKATARFKVWAQTPGVSKGVQDFLDYVHQNAPAITSTIGSLTEILPKLTSALGGLGTTDLQVISEFLSLLASLPQGVFNVLVTGTLVIVALVKVIKIWTAAQLVLDAALDANPISILILAVAALGIALVVAYKKSATFRDVLGNVIDFVKQHWAPILILLSGPVGLAVVLIVKNFAKVEAAVKGLINIARALWNSGFQPALKFIVNGLSFLIDLWAKTLKALGHVPGFGWAKSAGDAMQAAADKARKLADNINKIPTSKSVQVVLNVVEGVVHTTGGRVPLDPGNPRNPGNPRTPIPVRPITINVTAPLVAPSDYDAGEQVVSAIRAYQAAGGVL